MNSNKYKIHFINHLFELEKWQINHMVYSAIFSPGNEWHRGKNDGLPLPIFDILCHETAVC